MHANIDDLSTASAGELVAALTRREVSAVELSTAAIERIERLDGQINAVVVRDFERALEAAAEADLKLARGERAALLGVPMTVKEAFNVEGLATTWGLERHKDFVASRDDLGISRLKAAGAVILGKTNVPPRLGDWQSDNPIYGRTNNPSDLGRSPGGSSGGSAAALAAGMVPLEIGSDIGGSIRVPASFCGVYGHKPSFDLVPARDHVSPGSDGAGADLLVVGPMSRAAADLDLALDVLAGPAFGEEAAYALNLRPPRHDRIAQYRVLVIDEHPIAALDPDVRAAVRLLADRLSREGAQVSDRTAALPDLAAAHLTYLRLLSTTWSRGDPDPARPPIDAHEWLEALDERARVRRRWATVFEDFDIVLAPIFGRPAFTHIDNPDWSMRSLRIDGRDTPYGEQLCWPGIASFPGLPATAVPVARSPEGLPIGVQIVGPYLEDRTPIWVAGVVGGDEG